jgi:hypothetical protein
VLKGLLGGGERIGWNCCDAERSAYGTARQTTCGAGGVVAAEIGRAAVETQRRRRNQRAKRAYVQSLLAALRAEPGDGVSAFLALARKRADAIKSAIAVAVAAEDRMSGHGRFLLLRDAK